LLPGPRPRATRHLRFSHSTSLGSRLFFQNRRRRVMPFSGAKAKLERYSSPKPQKNCSLYQLTRRLGRVCGCSTHVSEFYFRKQKTLYTPKLAKSSASRFSPSFLFLFKGNLKTNAEALAGERHKTLQENSPAHRDREHSCIHRSFRPDKAMPSTTESSVRTFKDLHHITNLP